MTFLTLLDVFALLKLPKAWPLPSHTKAPMQALYGGNINLPSPPTSPHMSGFSANQSRDGWQSQHLKPDQVSFSHENNAAPLSSVEKTNASNISGVQPPPLLRPYRSSPFLFEPSAQSTSYSNDSAGESGVTGTSGSNDEGPKSVANHEHTNIPTQKAASSVPASPSSGRSQLSPKAENYEDQANEFQELDFDMEDDEDMEQSGAKSQMTAAELRAHKRKMKRFRYGTYALICTLILIMKTLTCFQTHA